DIEVPEILRSGEVRGIDEEPFPDPSRIPGPRGRALRLDLESAPILEGHRDAIEALDAHLERDRIPAPIRPICLGGPGWRDPIPYHAAGGNNPAPVAVARVKRKQRQREKRRARGAAGCDLAHGFDRNRAQNNRQRSRLARSGLSQRGSRGAASAWAFRVQKVAAPAEENSGRAERDAHEARPPDPAPAEAPPRQDAGD